MTTTTRTYRATIVQYREPCASHQAGKSFLAETSPEGELCGDSMGFPQGRVRFLDAPSPPGYRAPDRRGLVALSRPFEYVGLGDLWARGFAPAVIARCDDGSEIWEEANPREPNFEQYRIGTEAYPTLVAAVLSRCSLQGLGRQD